MPGLSLGSDIGIDSLPIVADDQFQGMPISQDDLHFGASGVVKSIANRLITDAIDFVADHGMHFLDSAFDPERKPERIGSRGFLACPPETLGQIIDFGRSTHGM